MPETVIVERKLNKRPDPAVLLSQLSKCVSVAMKGNRGTGWSHKIPRNIVPTQDAAGVWVHRVQLTFNKTINRESVQAKWPRILQRLAEACCAGGLRDNPWVIVTPGGYEHVAKQAKAQGERAANLKKKGEEPKSLGEINLEPGEHFSRIYGRDSQIRRVMDTLRLAKRTEYSKRNHSLLMGPPGCGKTDTMLSTRRMLGEEGEAWRWLDATSMTSAGVIEDLIESPHVPPILFIEEVEKADEKSLRWLLGLMDVRGEIRRTNYRVGNQARNVRMVVIASANNVKLLKTVMSGALYSRFQNKVYFPRPSREIMRRILEREVAEIKGNPEWIEPTLQFAFDKWGMTDPRELITICSCGGDRLLSGEYQQDYENTMHPAEKRHLKLRAEKLKKGLHVED